MAHCAQFELTDGWPGRWLKSNAFWELCNARSYQRVCPAYLVRHALTLDSEGHKMTYRPNRKTAKALPGKKTVFQTSEQRNFTADVVGASMVDVARLKYLQRQYEYIGLRLYPLDDASLLAVCPRLDMYKRLANMDAAQSYLRWIGGAL